MTKPLDVKKKIKNQKELLKQLSLSNECLADQMSRLRGLLGNPEIASFYNNSGFGRFPQFGMYTGRTPFHGWFAKPDPDDPDKFVRNKSKLENKINPLINHYERVKEDTVLWEKLTELNKIPSIGGKIEFTDEVSKFTLSFDQLPKSVRHDFENNPESRGGRTLDEVKFKFQNKSKRTSL